MTTPNLIRAFLEEPWDYLFEGFVWAFLWQTLGTAIAGQYFIILAIDAFAWYQLKPKLNFNSVSGNTGQAFGYAIVAFAAFILISVGVVKFFQAAANLDIQSLFQRIGAAVFGAAKPPILEANPLAIWIVGSILIAKRETKTLIARLMEILATLFKVNLNLRNISTWILFLIIAAVGVAFHFQAKGVDDLTALTLTFIFWMVSCFLIVKTRESESAVYLHMINNGWTLSKVL